LSRRREKAQLGAQESISWVTKALQGYGEGVHRLAGPAYVLDTELPVGLAEVYRSWNGLELFHESLILWPANKVRRNGDYFAVGEVNGDDLMVAVDGKVWRRDADSEELLCDGSAFDRWLAGYVDAEAVVFERDGEFRDDVIDEDGDLIASAALARERAMLDRDRDAPAPRWRLARLLSRSGELERARDELERVVDGMPDFSWAWYDLARISEGLGELEGACDELEAAATAQEGYEHNGFFWAQLARVARAMDDEDRRRDAAARALAATPDIAQRQLEGARASAADGDLATARELAETARAVAPNDLQVMAFLRQLE